MEPGTSELVAITIDPAATNHPFSVWDYGTCGFLIRPGEYTLYVGNAAFATSHTATLTVG
jgi:beta-glucosidase